jgi:hypothetical protein
MENTNIQQDMENTNIQQELNDIYIPDWYIKD